MVKSCKYFVRIIWLIIGILGITGCQWADYPSSVPVRQIESTENISLLWDKEINEISLIATNKKNVILWSTKSNSLIALDLLTGDTRWEVEAPVDGNGIRLYGDRIFIKSSQVAPLENAPVRNNRELRDCLLGLFRDKASLLTYDGYTGEYLWGYVYNDVDSNEIFFENQSVYLLGSGNHGDSRSFVEIDVNSGELIRRECYKGVKNNKIPNLPEFERYTSSPYRVVYNESNLRWEDVILFFAPKDDRLNILDGSTREIIGYIDFDGAKLNSYHIDPEVTNDIIVIYLDDSNQLISFRLLQSES